MATLKPVDGPRIRGKQPPERYVAPRAGSLREASSCIIEVSIDEQLMRGSSRLVEQERKIAALSLVDDASVFALDGGPPGPYRLHVSVSSSHLSLTVSDVEREPLLVTAVALGSFRRLLMEYMRICEHYFDAAKAAPPSIVQRMDRLRRSLHDEGVDLLRQALLGRITLDDNTARRLFTLMLTLHMERQSRVP